MGLLGSAIGAAGSLLAGGLNYYGQKSANKQNLASAREAMQFSHDEYGTQYQRSMEDMRKAGLNPILAAKFGGGGAPSGVSAQSQNELGGAVSSALESKRMQADLENLRESNKKIQADTSLAKETERSVREDIWNKKLTAGTANALGVWQQRKIMSEIKNLDYDSALKQLDAQIYSSSAGAVLRALSMVPGLGGALSGVAGGLAKKAPNITKVYR